MVKKIQRTLNYYQLDFQFSKSFSSSDGNLFREFFYKIKKMTDSKDPDRYFHYKDKYIFIQDIISIASEGVIQGKVRCVRKDVLPEMINTRTDIAKAIDAGDDEGLVETSHFVIKYNSNPKILSFEVNQFGASFFDFIKYLERFGEKTGILEIINYNPVIRNELEKIAKNINRCSKLIVKVSKENLPQIGKISGKIFSAIDQLEENIEFDQIELNLKFDYRKRPNTNKANSLIRDLINSFIRKPESTMYFNKVEISAENSEKNNILEKFDLLIDKVSSTINVARKPRHKIIESSDMFDQMKIELKNKRI